MHATFLKSALLATACFALVGLIGCDDDKGNGNPPVTRYEVGFDAAPQEIGASDSTVTPPADGATDTIVQLDSSAPDAPAADGQVLPDSAPSDGATDAPPVACVPPADWPNCFCGTPTTLKQFLNRCPSATVTRIKATTAVPGGGTAALP